jgi:hypothetical protein
MWNDLYATYELASVVPRTHLGYITDRRKRLYVCRFKVTFLLACEFRTVRKLLIIPYISSAMRTYLYNHLSL